MPTQRIIRAILAFAAAVLLTSVLGSVFSTQFVIAGLEGIDVDVPTAARVEMTVADLGILETYLPAVAACFLPGFLIAGLCANRLGGSRYLWYAAAGFSAFVIELKIIEAALALMPIGGARSLAGLGMQGVAGAVGGLAFAFLTRPKTGAEA